jgi:putative protease
LNTIDHIDDLKGTDSLKIEGRMKEPAYVANVVSKYRQALDDRVNEEDRVDLKKTFNRTFTKGYLFHEDPKEITNTSRPNNFGYEVGRIGKSLRGMYEIRLTRTLNQNDTIRISHHQEDVNLTVVKLYDQEGHLINKADDVCYIKIKEKVSKGDPVYVTKDHLYYKELESSWGKEFRRFNLDIRVYAYSGAKLLVDAEGWGLHYFYESEETLGEAINNPTSKEQVIKQFSRLNDTVFELNGVEYEECNAFIPAKLMNAARRDIVQGLYDLKLNSQKKRTRLAKERGKISFAPQKPYLTASVMTQDQYDACVSCGIEEVYFENIVRRNQNDYQEKEGQLLIGGYGGIHHYRKTNAFVTDYSLNVVNATSCYRLFALGAKRVTLSYELNKKQMEELIRAYREKNAGDPALEMIVYGKAPLMFLKYCPMKKMDQCGVCRTKSYELKDEHGTFPIIAHDDCTTTILNGKTLNLLDELESIQGIEAFRLNFTTESKDQVVNTIREALGKLNGSMEKSVFHQDTDTRGHFKKEIL